MTKRLSCLSPLDKGEKLRKVSSLAKHLESLGQESLPWVSQPCLQGV